MEREHEEIDDELNVQCGVKITLITTCLAYHTVRLCSIFWAKISV